MKVARRSDVELLRMTRASVRLFGFLEALAHEQIWDQPAERIESSARRYLARHVMQSALLGYRGFPAVCCVSRNATAIHGVPAGQTVHRGDIVSVDIAATSLGWVADSAWTYVIPGASPRRRLLFERAWRAFRALLASISTGTTLRDIARIAVTEARVEGLSVIPRFVGHGLGRTLHEPPVLVFDPEALEAEGIAPLAIEEGMVLNIEPVYSAGGGDVAAGHDGWSFETLDRSDTVHFELTVVPEPDGCRVLQFDRLPARELPDRPPFGDLTQRA